VPAATGPLSVRPSRAWYAVAAVVAIAGVAGAILLGLALFHAVDQPIERFPSGRALVLAMQRGDRRTIYQQVRGVDPTPEGLFWLHDVGAGELACRVRGPGGQPVPTTASSNLTLTLGSDEYHAKRDFAATRTGAHAVSCPAPGVPEGARLALAVGPRIRILGFVTSIFGALAALFGGLAVGAVIAGLTALLRHQNRRRGESRSPGAPGPRARGG
jgi:hypothetical protein